jgi:hypothetical protein
MDHQPVERIMRNIYLTMTHGVEAALFGAVDPRTARLVRIQSSHLESKSFWKILQDLDYGFMIDACTDGVALVDRTSRQRACGMSRALYQGVPWIEYCFHRELVEMDRMVSNRMFIVNGVNCGEFFELQWNRRSQTRDVGRSKIKYVIDFLGSEFKFPSIERWCGASVLDGQVRRGDVGSALIRARRQSDEQGRVVTQDLDELLPQQMAAE